MFSKNNEETHGIRAEILFYIELNIFSNDKHYLNQNFQDFQVHEIPMHE